MAEKDTVKLALGPASWRTAGFNPSIKDVPEITHGGADVPADKVEEVKAKARENDLTIREVK